MGNWSKFSKPSSRVRQFNDNVDFIQLSQLQMYDSDDKLIISILSSDPI